ncbi:MAG TPA: phosphocholine cytidylyltransferase family protein [Vicinamibacterales bacterium]|nr:phosphocholine cytidylyltransferase family protein [Vicinamibacterales bacterium]
MLAVILAAGTSSRLYPLTADIPKALLEVAGRTILDRMLDALADARIARAVIVTGYRADRIAAHLAATRPRIPVETVMNAAFAETNNAASLAAARAATRGDAFVLCDGDVIFSDNPFPSLVAAREDSAIVVDRAAVLDDEAMKVAVDREQRVTRLSKQLDARTSAGESVGIQKVGGAALAALWDVLDDVLKTRAATAYYEDAFQVLIDRGVPFGVTAIKGGTWREVDDAADLAAARALLTQG